MKRKILNSLRRHKYMIVAIMSLLMISSIEAKSQNAAVIYQNWKQIGEAPTNYEVSVQIVKCHPDSAVQLQIELLNEGEAQTAHFNLTISNPATNQSQVIEISRFLEIGKLILPTCDNNANPDMRYALPVTWTPAAVEFSISFIQ
jgi:hypothetical protein